MNTILIRYTGAAAEATLTRETATGQIASLQAQFEFSSDWAPYPARSAVFTGSGVTVAVPLNDKNSCLVPASVLRQSGRLYVGAFATATEGDPLPRFCGQPAFLHIPQGVSAEAPAPDADYNTDYDQILSALAGKLPTDQGRENAGRVLVVGTDGIVRPESLPSDSETDPTVPEWAKQKHKPTYTAAEVGALSTDALSSAIDQALFEAQESGKFDGKDYTLTEADKTEIAELAADMVDIPDGGGGSSSSEWTKLGDITVSGTYEFNILAIDGGVVTLDTNAEGYSFMNGKRNIIVHAIDISATNVSRHLLQLRPKDYSAGTFDVYNMDGVIQSSVSFNTTQYKISIDNIWSVVMTGIPQYDRYKMRAFFPVMQPHGVRPIFYCNVSSLGFGASVAAGFGPSIFEKELFTFPYNPNYMVEKATVTYGAFYGINTDTMYNAVTIVKAGENLTRPKNDTIEFSIAYCPFVNGTRFEVWGANDV